MSHSPRRKTSELELLAIQDKQFVDKYLSLVVVNHGACWGWNGSIRKGRSTSHGVINFKDHTLYAHRIAYLLNHNRITEGMFVCHSCDNGICQNNDHLFEGTRQDNIDDMVRKGRGRNKPAPRGEANWKVTLTDKQVAELRKLNSSEHFTQRELAAKFSCSQSTVWRITNGLTRKL